MRKPVFAVAMIAVFALAALPAPAAETDVLRGKFGFNWLTLPSKTKCARIDGKLLAEFATKRYRCNLEGVTNTASGGKAQTCRRTDNRAEYLIFDTLAACEEERKTQESNED